MNKRSDRSIIAATMAVGSITLAGLLAAPPAHAQMPATQKQGEIQYVTGGIGLDESDAMKGAMKDYPLALTFASHRDGKSVYMADVPVSIMNSKGQTVLNVKTGGPYLLARLPAGEYRITAHHDGKMQTRNVSVKKGATARAVFEWR